MTEQEFFDLAERFRNTTDPDESSCLGDVLGRLIFDPTAEREPRL
jgi:hypothetical protein